MIGNAQTRSIGALHLDLSGGRAPSGRDFDKGWSDWWYGRAGRPGFSSAALAQPLRTEPEPLGNASEGHHVGQRDGLSPQRLRNPAPWRGPALPPLAKLLRDVA
jgi:hypothetical protein